MRTHTFVALVLLSTTIIPRAAAAQERPSLAELAHQVAPQCEVNDQPARVYTNADLKIRLAPTPPTTPPFPEIAPPTGILEHWADPDIEPTESATPLDQFVVPLWDTGIVPWLSSPRRPFRGQRQPIGNVQPLPEQLRLFRRPDTVMFSANGDFSSSDRSSTTTRMGSRTGNARATNGRAASRGASSKPSGRDGAPSSRGRSHR